VIRGGFVCFFLVLYLSYWKLSTGVFNGIFISEDISSVV